MDEFILLFRLDLITKEVQPSPEQLEIYMKQYQDWIGGIAAQNKFIGRTYALAKANGKERTIRAAEQLSLLNNHFYFALLANCTLIEMMKKRFRISGRRLHL